jgi:hypothetical protein
MTTKKESMLSQPGLVQTPALAKKRACWTVVREGSGYARMRLELTDEQIAAATVRKHAPDIRGVVLGHLEREIDREML